MRACFGSTSRLYALSARLTRVERVRIATWNVNSLRSRIDRVEALIQRHEVDVLALQETKAREDQLPLMGLQALGYDVAVAEYTKLVRAKPTDRNAQQGLERSKLRASQDHFTRARRGYYAEG